MAIKCFYHCSDHDGRASAAIIKYALSDVELIPFNHGRVIDFESIDQNDEVYMVDISTNIKDMVRLKDKCSKFYYIDHHDSVIGELNKRNISFGGLLDSTKSACELTWDYFFGEESIPYTILLLGKFDRFKLDYDERVEIFEYGLQSYDTDPDKNYLFWKKIIECKVNDDELFDEIINKGLVIKNYLNKMNKDISYKTSFELIFEGYRCIAINTPILGSKVFDPVWDEKNHDIMLRFHLSGNGSWNCSLYTYKDTIDVSKIATIFDGGGSKGAAGFRVKNLPFKVT